MQIRLDQLLTNRQLTSSRTAAQEQIRAGFVRVDGVVRNKPAWQTSPGARVEVEPVQSYVSRAGEKLALANQEFRVDFQGKTVLDVGSSTGGFSDYVLRQGAVRVFAVDVGTQQLHPKLRSDERIHLMEQTDIRDARLPQQVDRAVVDVSFISLRLILPFLGKHLKPGGLIIALCKPQFEAGAKAATKHKGVIKNDRLRRRILKEFEEWVQQRFQVIDKADSKVSGTKGNKERFFLLAPKAKR